MLKPKLFYVVLVSLVINCIIKENAASGTEGDGESSQSSSVKRYEPFMVVAFLGEIMPKVLPGSTPEILPPIYKLPTQFNKIGDEWKLGSGGYVFPTALCPELETSSSNAITVQDSINVLFPRTERCLFAKDFKENENQVCRKEPEFSLDNRLDEKGVPVVCGWYNHQKLVDVQYYNCGTENTLEQYGMKVQPLLENGATEHDLPPYKPRYLPIYEICYDFKQEKTLWTRHSPMTPALLSNPESPYKDLSNEFHLEDFSTDILSLDLPPETFSELKQKYESADPSTNKIYTLVPKNHMALLYWKKATTHMINSAPLLPELVPLMQAINNGIYLASVNLLVKLQQTLKIYTGTRPTIKPSIVKNIVSSIPIVNSAVANYESKTPVNISESNIWYRFVHNEIDESGVLIVLYNTQEIPQQKECKNGELLNCDFNVWSGSAEEISDEILKHAYCCKVSESRVRNLFSIRDNLAVKKAFDIQDNIKAALAEPVKSDGNEE